MPIHRAGLPATLAFAFLLAAGCSSTRQIETAPPQPAPPIAIRPDSAAAHPLVTVTIETGQTQLPEAVQRLRFRVSEIHFRRRDGTWSVHPADVNTFELQQGAARLRKTLLATPLPPAAYDSLAVTFTNVYAEYGANAGGPLTLPKNAPIRLALPFELAPNRPAALLLTLEPGASLSQGPDCRWLFLPFLLHAYDPSTAAP